MKQLLNVDMLVLDDIGTEYSTDWAKGELYKIINGRYNNGGALVVTSNYGKDELKARFGNDQTGERIVSRLTQMCEAIQIGGNDRRHRR